MPIPRSARNVSGIVTNNLRRSGLFAPIDPAAFIQKLSGADAPPNFADWRAIKAQALVAGQVVRQGDGRLHARFRLYDVFGGQQQAGQQYTTTPENCAAHCAYHFGCDLRAADRREGLFRYPHRLRR